MTCTSFPSGLKIYEKNQPFNTIIIPGIFILFVVSFLRYVILSLLLKPLATLACPNNDMTIRKFCEASWRMILYGTACIYGVYTFFFKPSNYSQWLYDSELFWKDWPNHEVTEEMTYLYALYFGLYLHQVIYIFEDTKTTDFLALFFHHIITLVIVLASWNVFFTRVGSFTMILHDVSDVFLEIAKCFNYAKIKHPRLGMGADIAFLIFAITFFWLRLGVFPMRVLYSSIFSACAHVTCAEPPTVYNCTGEPVYAGFIALLISLQLLQIFWGWKIVKVIGTVLSGHTLEDPREM